MLHLSPTRSRIRSRGVLAAGALFALLLPMAGAGWLRAAGAEARDPAYDATRNALPPPAPKLRLPKSGVLFHDDFSGDSLARWDVDRPDIWSVSRGMLRADLPDRKQEHSIAAAGDEAWTDYAVDLDVCMMRGVDKGVVVRMIGERGIGVDLRGPGYQDVLLQHGWRLLGKNRIANGNAVWHHIRLEARGHTYTLYVNGERMIERTDKLKSAPAGRIALPAYTGGVGQCTVYYDNVVVTALDPEE